MKCEVCSVKCELKDESGRMYNVHPKFFILQRKNQRLKDEETRMHNMRPGFNH